MASGGMARRVSFHSLSLSHTHTHTHLLPSRMPTTVHRLPYSAVNFWAYEKLTAAWIEKGWGGGWAGGSGATGHGGRPSDTIRRLACGGGAGLAACALAYPLDLVRTRLAAQMATGAGGLGSTPGIAGTLRGIVAAEGARGLYRGLGATLVQVTPALAINYSVYGRLRAAWMDGRPAGEQPTVRNGESV